MFSTSLSRRFFSVSTRSCLSLSRPSGCQQLSTSASRFAESRLKVDFYFDTVSPYTWPAFEVLQRYRDLWRLDINYKPVFLGGLTSGATNPYLNTMAECPNKAAYQFMDLDTRTAAFFNIPFKMREDPFRMIGVIGSLKQQRFITAVLKEHPDKVEKVIRNFWIRAWSEDQDVHTPEDIRIIGDMSGMTEAEVSQCLEVMEDPGVKQRLKEVTDEAVERGAFGSPTLYFSEESGNNEQMFWGSDRFEMVAAVYSRPWHGPNPSK